jgi:hypothetical protein
MQASEENAGDETIRMGEKIANDVTAPSSYVQELAVGDDVVQAMPLMRFNCEGCEGAVRRMRAWQSTCCAARSGPKSPL